MEEVHRPTAEAQGALFSNPPPYPTHENQEHPNVRRRRNRRNRRELLQIRRTIVQRRMLREEHRSNFSFFVIFNNDENFLY